SSAPTTTDDPANVNETTTTTTSAPQSNGTSVPQNNGTSSPQSNNGTTSPQSSNVTSAPQSSNVTSAPQSNGGGAPPSPSQSNTTQGTTTSPSPSSNNNTGGGTSGNSTQGNSGGSNNSPSSPSPSSAGGSGGSSSEPAASTPVTVAYVSNLTTPANNIPLLYSSQYSSWYSYSIIATESYQFPAFILPFVKNTTSSSNSYTLGRLQVGWSASFGVVSIGGVSCSSYEGSASSGAQFTNSFGPTGACGSLLRCVDNSPYHWNLNGGQGGNNISSFLETATLEVGASFYANSAQLCTDASFYAVLTTSKPIYTAGAYSSYIVLVGNTSTSSNNNVSSIGASVNTTSATSAVESISTNQTLWNGSLPIQLTRSVQTIVLQKSIASKAATVQLVSFLSSVQAAPLNNINTPSPLLLSNTSSALAAECTVHDVSSYSMQLLPSGTFLSYKHDCDTVYYDTTLTTVPGLQNACDADTDCLGFTTYLQNVSGNFIERPYCMLRAGSSDSGFSYPRMAYLKRDSSSTTCSVITQHSGTLQIWIEQTCSKDTSVDVYINGFYERSCGTRSHAFASAVGGTSAACGTFNLCFSGQTYPQAKVEVIPSTTYAVESTSSNCTGALHVLFVQTSVDSVEVADQRPRYTPPTDLATNFSTRFSESRTVALVTAVSTAIRVYVRNTASAALAVMQTAYGCVENRTCPSYYIAFESTPVTTSGVASATQRQLCGGNKMFPGGYEGLDNQCDASYYCGGALTVNTSTNTLSAFSAATWLSITVDAATMYSSTTATLCKTFQSTLYLSPSNATTDEPSGFVLKAADSVFRALIAAPLVDASTVMSNANIAALSFTNETTISLTHLEDITVGPLEAMSVHYLEWSQLSPTNLSTNASMACVFDWISTTAATCTIVVPHGANHLKLSVEQSTFDLDGAAVTVTFNKQAAHSDRLEASSTTSCGGLSGTFSGRSPLHGACGVYLDCFNQYLYVDDQLMTSSPIISITISVPQAASSGQPCTATAVMLAEFEYRNVTKDETCDFWCTSDRWCVAYSKLCDGVIDCSDEADETLCGSFSIADTDARFNDTNATVVNDTGYLSCVRLAIGAGGSFFAHDLDSSICYLYALNTSKVMALNADAYLLTVNGTTLYRKTGSPYSRCTSANTCNANGDVVTLSGACQCFCYEGYYGPQCEMKLLMTDYGGVVIMFDVVTLDASGVTISDLKLQMVWALESLTSNTYTCDTIARDPNNSNVTLVYCHPSGTTTSDFSLFENSVTGTSKFNWKMTGEYPKAKKVELFSVPVFAEVPTCSLGTNVSCNMTSDVGIKNVVIAWKQTGNPQLSISIAQSSTTRRRLGGATTSTTFSCTKESTVIVTEQEGPNCGTFSCMLPVDATGVESLVATINTTVGSGTPQCSPAVTSVSYSSLLTITSVSTPDSISNVNESFEPFLISGVVLIILSVIVFAFSVTMCYLDGRHVRKLTYHVHSAGFTELNTMLRTTFLKMGYYEQMDVFVRKERLSVAMLVIGVNLLIAGVFLVLYYATGSGFTSSSSILVEQYVSSSCSSSTTSSVAFSAFTIPGASSSSCLQRQVIGSTSAALYASGNCYVDDNGNVMAKLRTGTSSALCAAAPFVTVPSGSCVAVGTVAASLNGSSYASVMCGDAASIALRVADFTDLTTSSTTSDTILSESLSDAKRQPWSNSSLVETIDGTTVYPFTGVYAGFSYSPTSSMDSTLESSSSASPFEGDSTRDRLLVMVPEETFTAPTTENYHPITSAMEETWWRQYSALSGSAVELGPQDGDLPLGRTYNKWNTTSETSGSDAGALSAHYFDIQNSSLDMGS
ncbi:transmembrane protein, putative, partial [Bodo saltans]